MYRLTIVLLLFVAYGYCFDFPEPPNYGWGVQTDLDRYVNSDDGYYSWDLLSITEQRNAFFYVLNMTSQKWVDESFCSRAIWWHYMGIAVPKDLIRDDIAIIYQKGGTNEEEPPTANDFESEMALRCAVDTGTVCAYVKQVPNQPIVFYNDPSLASRIEDQIIAWSWVSFGETYNTSQYNPALPLRNPMTKAVKRGMDAVNEFVKTVVPGSEINKFLVTGISKRGWTAWSTAMTDRRVIAIIPMVFSLLHMEETVMNHYKALENNWSFALQPYWQENLTQYMLEPLAWGPGGLYDFEDIYRYRSRLNIPKLSIGATGDEFFFPQDFHAWWVNMTGTKLLRMLPNTDHVMVGQYMDMYDTEIAFYEFILLDGGTSLPTLTWSRSETATGAELILHANPPPRINTDTGTYDVQTWIAVTHPDDTRRDFRLFTADGAHNVRWENSTTEELENPGWFRSTIDRDLEGEWVGHFIEATWTSPSGRYSLTLTTEVNYLPYDYYPGVACTNQQECYGALV